MVDNQQLLIHIIKLISISGILLYIISLIICLFTWIKKEKFTSVSLHSDKFTSIIVAVRNEEKNLPDFLSSIENQIYPAQNFELLLIDDHSNDGSLGLMKKFASGQKNASILSLSEGEEGKKRAIRYGIEHAKGELILTTDADCSMSPEWLSNIVAFQQANHASMIIGPVAYLYKDSFFEKIQALEFSSLIASGASSAILGMPILCNGANLAFLKSVYPTEGQLMEKHSPSGDDIFLLQHLKKTSRNSIYYLKCRKSIVYTNPSPSLKDFISQRKRWFGKSKHYSDYEILGFGMLVSFANFILLLSLLLSLIIPAFWQFFLFLFLLKLITDTTFLYPFLSFIQARRLLWLAPVLEILYPFYIFYVIIATRINKYKWKNRDYSGK